MFFIYTAQMVLIGRNIIILVYRKNLQLGIYVIDPQFTYCLFWLVCITSSKHAMTLLGYRSMDCFKIHIKWIGAILISKDGSNFQTFDDF